jgi:predicted DNA-binding transcriptional regulator YafY
MKIHRHLGILLYLLVNRYCTAKELSEYFEVSVRTIYRDMEDLSLAGIPVEADQGLGGGYGLRHDYHLDRQLMNSKDLESFVSVLKGLEKTLPDPDRSKTLQRVEKMLPGDISGNEIIIDMMPWGLGNDFRLMLNKIYQAIHQKTRMHFTYQKSGSEELSRLVEPYSLVFRGSSWYLFAFCLERNDYRLFRLTRIIDLKRTTDRFEPREDSKYQSFEAQNWDQQGHPITIRVDLEQANRVKEEFRQFEQKWKDDCIEIQVQYPWHPWVKGYFLSWGSSLEVLAPENIRLEMMDEYKKLVKKYQ